MQTSVKNVMHYSVDKVIKYLCKMGMLIFTELW